MTGGQQGEQGVNFSVSISYRVKLLVDIMNYVSEDGHERVAKINRVKVEGK